MRSRTSKRAPDNRSRRLRDEEGERLITPSLRSPPPHQHPHQCHWRTSSSYRVPGLEDDVGKELAEALGRLPLALEQAAAYLDREGMPVPDYLRLLHEREADLYGRGRVADRDETIATLWDISLERIAEKNSASLQLLELCAYLAPERIPLDLFTLHTQLLPEPLAAAAADELAFSETIGVLVDYSLMKRTGTGLQLHRLLQGAIRARHVGPPQPGAVAGSA